MPTKSNPFNHVGFLCPSGTIRPKLSLVTFPKLQIERKPRLKKSKFHIYLLCGKDENGC